MNYALSCEAPEDPRQIRRPGGRLGSALRSTQEIGPGPWVL